MLQLFQLLCLSCMIPNTKAWNIKNFYSIPLLECIGRDLQYIVVKTGRAWEDSDGSKHWNILLKAIFLEITGAVHLNQCSITVDSVCSHLYLQALNQCSWASELAECSCRWQDIHLERRGEGCTMQRIEQRMKGHFVSCRGWARGSHHSRSGVIPGLGTSVLFFWLSETTCPH